MSVGVVAVPYRHSSATHLILYRVFWRDGNITVQSYSVLSYFLTAAGQTPPELDRFSFDTRGENLFGWVHSENSVKITCFLSYFFEWF